MLNKFVGIKMHEANQKQNYPASYVYMQQLSGLDQ